MVLNEKTIEWKFINDEIIEKVIDIEKFLRKNQENFQPYILFYRKSLFIKNFKTFSSNFLSFNLIIENFTKNSLVNKSVKTITVNIPQNPLMRDITMNSIHSSKKESIERDFSMNSIRTTQDSPSKIKRDQTMQSFQSKENDCNEKNLLEKIAPKQSTLTEEKNSNTQNSSKIFYIQILLEIF